MITGSFEKRAPGSQNVKRYTLLTSIVIGQKSTNQIAQHIVEGNWRSALAAERAHRDSQDSQV